MSFAQSGFAQFVVSPAGRFVRMVVGLALIAWGVSHRHDIGGIVLPAVGLLGFWTGALDVCVISAVLGGPLSGARIRESKPRT